MTDNTPAQSPIAVLGAGSFGTALAIQLARCGNETRLWGRDAEQIKAMQASGNNSRYLPDAEFPAGLKAVTDIEAALEGGSEVLVVTPSHGFRPSLELIKPLISEEQGIAWAAKGLERGTGEFLHEVAQELLGAERPLAIVSGPTFAKEIAAGMPAAVTVASPNLAFASSIAMRLHGQGFRAYTHDDLIGVQLAGAVKNVLALAAGLVDGLGFGANTRAAMITRGLAEMMRLGDAVGAQRDTFMGLAGLGDLVLTCTDNQSRNRRMGLAVAEGKTVDEAAKAIGQVVEGVPTAAEVQRLAERHQIEMPIATQVFRVFHEQLDLNTAINELLARRRKREFDGR